ncbi:sporulation protein [Bacillus altitudinis]|uniref:sporulation protein n=1 Tax=Bacillus altitudinis TaxID=293387 RepID=UPI0023544C40|nr:sporulation protein [Bacillus altitudinis]
MAIIFSPYKLITTPKQHQHIHQSFIQKHPQIFIQPMHHDTDPTPQPHQIKPSHQTPNHDDHSIP